MNDYLAISLGVLCAGIGGELFVRGAVGIARWVRIPAGIIGVTIAAFATSSPELSVAATAALAGAPQLSLGDALGSNIVNISLILALVLLMSGIQTSAEMIKRDFSFALLAPVIIGLLAFDGQLSRMDGVILLIVFTGWLSTVVIGALGHRKASGEALAAAGDGQAIFMGMIGIALLIAAGRLIVSGAKGLATVWGMDEFIVGATVVAVATGTPEIATTIIANWRGHPDLGLGNLLGSNIFNGLLIVAVAAIIAPITIVWNEVAVGLFFGILTTLIVFPFRGEVIGRKRGIFLLAVYGLYLVLILQMY